MAVVYAATLPGGRRLESAKHLAVHQECVEGDDYWQGLAHWWDGQQTIVNVEHDMHCSDALIDELVECPEPLCTHAYQLYLPTTGQPEPHSAHNRSLKGLRPPIKNIVHYTAGGIEWLTAGEWADFSGIGFCKITPEVRCAALERQGWRWLEMSVNAAVNCRWHVHWPGVEHHHQEDR